MTPSASSFQRAPMPRHALRVARSAERRTRFRPCPWGSSRSPEPPRALQERSRRATATTPLPNRGPHSARGAARRGEGARRGRSRGRGDATPGEASLRAGAPRVARRVPARPPPCPGQQHPKRAQEFGGWDISRSIFSRRRRSSGAYATPGTDPARAPARSAPIAAWRPARIRALPRGRAAAVFFCVRVVWRRVRQPPTDRQGKKKKKRPPLARVLAAEGHSRGARRGGRLGGGREGVRRALRPSVPARDGPFARTHTHTLPPHLVSLNPHARALPCAPHARVQARCGKGSSGRRTIREDGRHAEPGRPWRRGRRG